MTDALPTGGCRDDGLVERVIMAGNALMNYASNGRPGLIADQIREWEAATAALAHPSPSTVVSDLVERLRNFRDGSGGSLDTALTEAIATIVSHGSTLEAQSRKLGMAREALDHDHQ